MWCDELTRAVNVDGGPGKLCINADAIYEYEVSGGEDCNYHVVQHLHIVTGGGGSADLVGERSSHV